MSPAMPNPRAPEHPDERPAAAPMGVVVTEITKRFSRRAPPVVDRVTFTAPAGGITTLLGPSGSGKSTVLRLLAGLEQPENGRVCIGGRDVTATPAAERGVGFVFQSYALFRHLTVRQNIAFGLHGRDPAEVARIVDGLMTTVELDGYGDRRPDQLSGGQRQRVAFARALAIEPKVLLLDEPFAALDAKVRGSLRSWLRAFHERHLASGGQPVTTLLVTHDQEEAMELSESIVVMREGRVEQAGTPRDVYDRPASPFVASFVGRANILPGRDGSSAPGEAAFVRPHEVRLRKPLDGVDVNPSDGVASPAVVLARVQRLAFLGPHVKIALRLPDGADLLVELSKAEVDAMQLGEGDRVMADLGEAKIFVSDYSI